MENSDYEKKLPKIGWVCGAAGVVLLAFGETLVARFLGGSYLDQQAAVTLRTIQSMSAIIFIFGISLLVLAVFFIRFPARSADFIKKRLDPQSIAGVHRSETEKVISLFLISFLGLYFELLIIRWLAAEIRMFAYFVNLPLMSSFLGLGLGFLLVQRFRRLHLIFPVLITTFLVLIVAVALTVGLYAHPSASQEFIWSLPQKSTFIQSLFFYAVLIFFFFFTVACFIPLGYLTGSFMQHFPPIKAYSINVLGSLFGIWTFSALSFFSTPPIVWFLLGFALFLVLIRRVRFFLIASAAIFAVFLLCLAYIRQPAYWSPYYKIDVAPIYESGKEGDVLWGYSLNVNQDYHQNMLNLSAEFSREHGDLPLVKPASFAYDSIYEIFPAKDVLIVGAGSGNDVAAALRNGAEYIDAVEIDPVILKLGKKLHPEAPYDSERVHIVNDDARAFFNKTKKKYDVIVFGLLDSHTMISGMSNLRLDNYVYTVESFRKAKAHLKENGIVALSFSVQQDWIGARISRILEEVFQQTPICYRTNYDLGIMFIVGPGLSQLLSQPSSPALKFVRANLDLSNIYTKHDAIPLSTDDWPYLYLKDKKISWSYLIPLAVILVLSLGMTLRMVSESRKISFPFFFLGGAFLLIEFKSITDMALLFGSTWLVNSFVISSILLMILGANYIVSRFQPGNITFLYVLLGLCLLFNYLIPVSSLLSQSFLIRGIIGSAFLSLPIFFAGIIFATFLKRTAHIDIAFGSNLLGAVIGGLLEYSSMVYGLRNLLILSAVLYALSLITARRSRMFFPD